MEYDGPPALTAARVFTEWTPDLTMLLVLAAFAGAYAYGTIRLRRRGDRWAVGRDISYYAGIALIGIATMSFLGTYDDTLFWVHMAQHMVLSMVAPIFLALGAPLTLLLRLLPRRQRRGLTRALHSVPAKLLINPLTGFTLLIATPFVLYMTGLYGFTLTHDWAHELIHAHFVLAGSLFFWPIIGVDPVPGRMPHIMRVLFLFVSLPAHAWLGITVMTSKTVIAGDYYRALARPWGPSLSHDQAIGGGLLWSSGDLVGLLVIAALFAQWSAADRREATRTDRRLDRETAADAELAAYNRRLAALAERYGG